MARPRSQETLERLRDAALEVFSREGFARARIADVARKIGVAHGTVYGYADGKQALFLLALSPEPLPLLADLPLARPGAATIRKAVEARAAALHALRPLGAALARSQVLDGFGELTGILAAHYDVCQGGARELALLERTAAELPAVALALQRQRRDLRERMRRYIESRVALGWIEPLSDPGIAARAVLDAVASSARRNQCDPDPVFRPEALARETVITWAARGLLVAETAEAPAADEALH